MVYCMNLLWETKRERGVCVYVCVWGRERGSWINHNHKCERDKKGFDFLPKPNTDEKHLFSVIASIFYIFKLSTSHPIHFIFVLNRFETFYNKNYKWYSKENILNGLPIALIVTTTKEHRLLK